VEQNVVKIFQLFTLAVSAPLPSFNGTTDNRHLSLL